MKSQNRIWELDFIRGIAIILMVIFHALVILKDIYAYNINYMAGFWRLEGLTAATLFIFAAGISSTFSKNNLLRGIKIFGLGYLLTLVTFIYNPEFYIKFGILHFLGTSMIIYHYMNKFNNRLLFSISILSLIVGSIFSKLIIQNPFLFPLGLMTNTFGSLDYYPLLPWIGIFLLGSVIGMRFYSEKRSLLKVTPKLERFTVIGRHSLIIYLTHVPIIMGLFWLLIRK